jgi:hypothetical protein
MRFDQASIRPYTLLPYLLAILLGPLAGHAELNESPRWRSTDSIAVAITASTASSATSPWRWWRATSSASARCCWRRRPRRHDARGTDSTDDVRLDPFDRVRCLPPRERCACKMAVMRVILIQAP